MKVLGKLNGQPIVGTVVTAGLVAASSLATYTLGTGDVTKVGGAFTDIANSLFGVIGDLLPIAVPVIVIWFAYHFVMGRVGRR